MTDFTRDADGIWRFRPGKDPAEVIDFGVDFSDALDDGETLTGAAWTVPAGLTQVSAATVSPRSAVVVSGGTSGSLYDLVCAATTSASRTLVRRVRVRVQPR